MYDAHKSKCYLCSDITELSNSHIYPNFIVKFIKKHNLEGNNKIIKILSVHKKAQQAGLKEKLLCQKCEQLFSVYEKHLKTNFYEKLENNIPIDYQELNDDIQIQKALISILWRALIYSIEFEKKVYGNHQSLVDNFLNVSKSFFFNDTEHKFHTNISSIFIYSEINKNSCNYTKWLNEKNISKGNENYELRLTGVRDTQIYDYLTLKYISLSEVIQNQPLIGLQIPCITFLVSLTQNNKVNFDLYLEKLNKHNQSALDCFKKEKEKFLIKNYDKSFEHTPNHFDAY